MEMDDMMGLGRSEGDTRLATSRGRVFMTGVATGALVVMFGIRIDLGSLAVILDRVGDGITAVAGGGE